MNPRAEQILVEKPLRAAFLEFARRAATGAQITQIERLVAAGDVEGVAEALNIKPAELSDFAEEVRAAYLAGGQFAAGEVRLATRAEFRFDMRAPAAEQWLRLESSNLVTRIVEEQRDAIRAALDNGMRRGIGPRSTALDIAGRINPATGRRSGGIVGLSRPQSDAVASLREKMAEGDLSGLLDRKALGQREKNILTRAIRADRGLTSAEQRLIGQRYANRLLLLRGETIARTESTAAFNAAREQAYEQAVRGGQLRRQSIKKIWDSAGDGRVRDSHAAMDGDEVAFDQPFTSPTGAQMMYPGDSSLGAGGEDIINCRCTMRVEVDFIGEALANAA